MYGFANELKCGVFKTLTCTAGNPPSPFLGMVWQHGLHQVLPPWFGVVWECAARLSPQPWGHNCDSVNILCKFEILFSLPRNGSQDHPRWSLHVRNGIENLIRGMVEADPGYSPSFQHLVWSSMIMIMTMIVLYLLALLFDDYQR